MSSFKKWTLVLMGGVGYTALIASTYIVSMQYALFQSATNFTDTQMGTIASLVGVVALFGYLFGGVLSDFFKTKTLMVISHLLAPVLLMIMSTLPRYEIVLVLQLGLAVFAIFTYWSPMAKFVSDLGAPEEEGKRYGFFFAAASISGTLIGVVASSLSSRLDSISAMRLVYYIYAALNVVVALIIILMYKPASGNEVASEDDKFQLKYAVKVLKMPAVWLVGIMGFAGYMTGKVMVYTAPLMMNVFSVSVATVTLINAFGNYGIAIFMSPLAGILTDKFRSATRVMLYMLIAFGASLAILIIIPWENTFFPVVVVLAMLVSAYYAIDQTNWFTPLSEITIPAQVRGTAIGIVSVLMFSSDAFAYIIYGDMIDRFGNTGFYYIFASTLAVTVIGIIATVVLRKKIRTKQNIEDTANE